MSDHARESLPSSVLPPDLQEVERDAARLLKAITAGEWRWGTGAPDYYTRTLVADGRPTETLIFRLEDECDNPANAAFIAAAPRLIRGLLALLAVPARRSLGGVPPEVEPPCGHERLKTESIYVCKDCGVRGSMTGDDFVPFVAVPAREQGWQPIESAPKDGTPVLILAADDERFVGCWKRGGWELYGAYARISPVRGWQPLPPPPRGSEIASAAASDEA